MSDEPRLPDSTEAVPLVRPSRRPAQVAGPPLRGARALRGLQVALGAQLTAFVALTVVAAARVAAIGFSLPEVLTAGLGVVFALPCGLAVRAAWRAEREVSLTGAARDVAQTIGHLRAIFILRATVLFLLLGASCLVFSVLVAFLAAL